MGWARVPADEYRGIFRERFLTVFEEVDFISTTSYSLDEVYFLVYKNDKVRFGVNLAIVDRVVKIPFSAPYSNFVAFSKSINLEHYHDAMMDLISFFHRDVRSIEITLPPLEYDREHITKLYYALIKSGYKIDYLDINYHFDLRDFTLERYAESLELKSRQKLRQSLRNNLIFQDTKDIKTVYSVIEANRKEKGYPLKLGVDQIERTLNIIKRWNAFTVSLGDSKVIASAIVYGISPQVYQVIYWGNLPKTENLKPMNYLAFKVFEFYSSNGVSFVDIGTATDKGEANYGLCSFKESVGCTAAPKPTFKINIR